MKKKWLHLVVHTLVPIAAGCLIYLCSRDLKPLYFCRWFGDIGTTSIDLPYWLRYNLPDFLWMYAFTAAFCITWSDRQSIPGLIWKFIIPVIAFGSEWMQAERLIPGTYDRLDVVAYAAAAATVLFFYKQSFHQLNTYKSS